MRYFFSKKKKKKRRRDTYLQSIKIMDKLNHNIDFDSNSKQTCIKVYFENLPIEKIKLDMKITLDFV